MSSAGSEKGPADPTRDASREGRGRDGEAGGSNQTPYISSARVFARNLLANWVGLAAEVVVAFFLTPFIVGGLGATAYGVWSVTNGVVGYLGLVDLGMRGSIGRFINHYLARGDRTKLAEVLGTAFVAIHGVGLLMVGLAVWLGWVFPILFAKTPPELHAELRLVLPLLAASAWLTALASVYRNLLQAWERFDVNNAVNLIALAVRAGGVVWVLSLGYGLVALAAVTLATSACALGTAYVASRRVCGGYHRLRPKFSKARFSEMFRFGIAAFTTRAASELMYRADAILVMLLFGPRWTAVYSVANILITNAQRLVEQIPIFPSIMKAGSLRDYPGLQRLFLRHLKLSFYIGTLVYGGFVVFGQAFLELWMGNRFLPGEYAAAWAVLLLLSSAELVSFFGRAGRTLLFSLDKLRFNVVSSLAEVFLNVVFSVGVVWLLGLPVWGIAVGTLVATVCVRGIASLLVGLQAIGLPLRRYLREAGWRALALVGFTVPLFLGVERLLVPGDWLGFFFSTSVAAMLYVPLGAFIVFGRDWLRWIGVPDSLWAVRTPEEPGDLPGTRSKAIAQRISKNADL